MGHLCGTGTVPIKEDDALLALPQSTCSSLFELCLEALAREIGAADLRPRDGKSPIPSSLSTVLADLGVRGRSKIPDALMEKLLYKTMAMGLLHSKNIAVFQNCRLAFLRLTGCDGVTDDWICTLLHAQMYPLRLTEDTPPLMRRLSFDRVIEQSLVHLDLSGCAELTDDALLPLVHCPLLRSFRVAGCSNFTDYGLAVLGSMPLLEQVQVDRCVEMTDVTVGLLADKTALHTLRYATLYLSCCNVCELNIRDLVRFLVRSIAACPKVTDAGLEKLSTLSALTSINLSHCRGISSEALLKFVSQVRYVIQFQDVAFCFR